MRSEDRAEGSWGRWSGLGTSGQSCWVMGSPDMEGSRERVTKAGQCGQS